MADRNKPVCINYGLASWDYVMLIQVTKATTGYGRVAN
jgi:hypothetical protein